WWRSSAGSDGAGRQPGPAAALEVAATEPPRPEAQHRRLEQQRCADDPPERSLAHLPLDALREAGIIHLHFLVFFRRSRPRPEALRLVGADQAAAEQADGLLRLGQDAANQQNPPMPGRPGLGLRLRFGKILAR